MTYTSKGGNAPPAPPAQPLPAVPRQPGAPEDSPARRTAFMEGVDELRAAAVTEPGRLRIIGAALALLVVAFGAVTAWQMTDRSAAADDVLHHSQPLSRAAADVYRSLAGANTAASSGFLEGGQETRASREEYERNIDEAAAGLAKAAGAAEPGSASERTVAELTTLLPEYKGYVERARANNRQGYPLGGAYLRYANDTMQDSMLPRARELYTSENRRLRADYDDATAYPWAAIGLGAAAIGALVWAQRRNYLLTNRVLNRGLVAATAATGIVLVWLAAGHTLARAGLNESYDHGVRSLNVLNDARIASLNARGNENLTLVARGAETDDNGEDAFDVAFRGDMDTLTAKLKAAEDIADDQAGQKPVRTAVGGMEIWLDRHKEARALDQDGDYQAALNKVIGTGEHEPTGECFELVVKNLSAALTHEQREFEDAADSGRGAMSGLPLGASVLGVLGAAGAVLGVGRRLSEYR